jgi:hypothetical protein
VWGYQNGALVLSIQESIINRLMNEKIYAMLLQGDILEIANF